MPLLLTVLLLLAALLAAWAWWPTRRPSHARKRYEHIEAVHDALMAAERDGYLDGTIATELMDTVDDRLWFYPHDGTNTTGAPINRRTNPRTRVF
jgi:hypothetical protein